MESESVRALCQALQQCAAGLREIAAAIRERTAAEFGEDAGGESTLDDK